MTALLVYGRPACPACDVMKQRLKQAKIAFQYINLDAQPEYAQFLRACGYRALPMFGVRSGIQGFIDHYAAIEDALRAVQKLYEQDLEECSRFFSPASDHFENQQNRYQKEHLAEQIAAAGAFLEA